MCETYARRRHLLAIHSVGHSAMARNAVSEVLDVECTLEPRGEEPAEGCDKGRKARHEEKVELVGYVGDCGDGSPELQNQGQHFANIGDQKIYSQWWTRRCSKPLASSIPSKQISGWECSELRHQTR